MTIRSHARRGIFLVCSHKNNAGRLDGQPGFIMDHPMDGGVEYLLAQHRFIFVGAKVVIKSCKFRKSNKI